MQKLKVQPVWVSSAIISSYNSLAGAIQVLCALSGIKKGRRRDCIGRLPPARKCSRSSMAARSPVSAMSMCG